MTDRTNDPGTGFEELEARLAAYGDVLRDEVGDASDKRRAAVPGGLAATAVTELGASTAPTRRERLRTGVLVAAVLALIASLSFIGIRPNDPGTTIEVATEPTSAAPAPAAAGLDGDGGDDESTDQAGDGDLDESSYLYIQSDLATDNAEADDGDGDNDGDGDGEQTVSGAEGDDGEQPGDQGDAGNEEATDEPDDQADDDGDGTDQPEEDQPDDQADEGDEETTDIDQPDEDEAPVVELVCEEGELVNGECRIIGPAPNSYSTTCPTGPQQFEDAQGCYTLIAAGADACEGLVMYDDDYCSEVTDWTTDLTACPDNYDLRASDGMCTQTTVSESADALCTIGTLQADQRCLIVEDQLEFPAGTCPDDDLITHTVIDGDCYRLESPSCGALAVADNGSECEQPSPVEPEQVCWGQPNVGIINGLCATAMAGDEFCPDGAILEGFRCLFSQPAEGDPLTCPTGWYLIGDPNGGPDFCQRDEPVSSTCDPQVSTTCYILEGPPEDLYRCLMNGQIVDVPDDCWTPVPMSCLFPDCLELLQTEDLPPVSFCDAQYDWELIDGQCTRYEAPYIECEIGDHDGNGGCVPGADVAPSEQDVCIGEDRVEVGPDCHRLILAGGSCNGLSPIDGGCRQPADAIGGEEFCEEGFELVGGECIRWEDPIEVAS